MKKVLIVIMLLFSLFLISCKNPEKENDNNDNQDNNTVTISSIVIYFSCTNNTKKVAEKISQGLTSPIEEIVPKIPYTSEDLDYSLSTSRTSIESNDPTSRPEFNALQNNLNEFDVIYVGYPIWWGTMPKIMYTFFESYDFSGKTIVPFCTSGGSSISTSVTQIKRFEPNAKVVNGKKFSSSSTQDEINNWLKQIKD